MLYTGIMFALFLMVHWLVQENDFLKHEIIRLNELMYKCLSRFQMPMDMPSCGQIESDLQKCRETLQEITWNKVKHIFGHKLIALHKIILRHFPTKNAEK